MADEPEEKAQFIIRSGTIADIKQISEIYNHWIATAPVALIENPISTSDLTYSLHKIRPAGCAFLVACNPDNYQDVYGFHYVRPELFRQVKIDGIMVTATFIRKDKRGLRMFDHFVANYIALNMNIMEWTGSYSESYYNNARMRSKFEYSN